MSMRACLHFLLKEEICGHFISEHLHIITLPGSLSVQKTRDVMAVIGLPMYFISLHNNVKSITTVTGLISFIFKSVN